MIERGIVSVLKGSVTVGTGFFVRSDLIMTCHHVVATSLEMSENGQNKCVKCCSSDGNIFFAEIIEYILTDYKINDVKESIVLLKTENYSDIYFRFCSRQIDGATVFGCGYPNRLTEQLPFSGIIDSQTTIALHLKESNNISLGCSGAPVLYKNADLSSTPVVVGIIGKIYEDVDHHRLLGSSSAISAQEIISKASQYIEIVPETLLVTNDEVKNKFVYNYKDRIPLIGRNKELNDLESFCQSDKRQVWWAMVGKGGTGKSRLALELAERKHKDGWDVFFVSRRLKDHLEKILDSDKYNTLIIVDYILTAGNALSEFLKRLYECIEYREHCVKVLIVERDAQKSIIQSMLGIDSNMIESLKYKEYLYKKDKDFNLELQRLNDLELEKSMLDKDANMIEFLQNKEYISKNEVSGYLELQKLDDIHLKALIAECAQIDKDHPDVNEIYETLKIIDHENERPLYAMFICDSYKHNRRKITAWDIENALEYVCRNEEKNWFLLCNLNNLIKQEAFKKVVTYVTFNQGLEYSEVKNKCSDELMTLWNTDLSLRSQFFLAELLTYDYISEKYFFTPLKPDLVGEYYILRYLKKHYFYITDLFELRFLENFNACLFLANMINDYPKEISKLRLDNYLFNMNTIGLDVKTTKNYVFIMLAFTSSEYSIDIIEKAVGCIENISRIDSFKDDPEFAYMYSQSIYNLILMQPAQDVDFSVQKLEALSYHFKDNEEIALFYASGLLQQSVNQSDEIHNIVDQLKERSCSLNEENKKYIAYQFPEDISQSVEGLAATVQKLAALCNRFEKNEKIATVYAKGLLNLAVNQSQNIGFQISDEINRTIHVYHVEYGRSLVEVDATVKRLEDLFNRFQDNEVIAIRLINGLVYLWNRLGTNNITYVATKLENLSDRFEHNDRVATECAKGLFALSKNITTDNIAVSTKKLESLFNRFKDNYEIATKYASRLADLIQQQDVEDAINSVEKLENLYNKFKEDEKIDDKIIEADLVKIWALFSGLDINNRIEFSYAKGLAHLMRKQIVKDAFATMQKLEDLYNQTNYKAGITSAYAESLLFIIRKQTTEDAAISWRKFSDLYN